MTSTADAGPGTLRQAILDAKRGDTITFDSNVFPPDAPATIFVTTDKLPELVQGRLTIDASDTGVIVDGSRLPPDSRQYGLRIVSDGNTVRGLQVLSFQFGILLAVTNASGNTIGGDQAIGRGPLGQGNLVGLNDYGITLQEGASRNVVVGNIVGTDPTGQRDLGNRSRGIWVSKGATDNVIGPDNLVAFTGGCGIAVEDPDTKRATVTRNRVGTNNGGGICLLSGANEGITAPLVSQLDRAEGSVRGTACAGCTVEVFSSDGSAAAVYEGSTISDARGVFTLDQATAFTGAEVTLTATSSQGNTSALSHPLTVVIPLQLNNTLPVSPLATRRSEELVANRVSLAYAGGGLRSHAATGQLALMLEQVSDSGAKRINTSLNELEAPIDWSAPENDIPPAFDELVNDLAARGVTVDYMLHFWDKEGYARGQPVPNPRFTTAAEVGKFIDHVRHIVRHFKGRIPYYTIWSEPDACGPDSIKCIEPGDYIALLRRVIPVIREEDPAARVAVAPNVLFFDRDDLFAVLRSDVAPMLDVVQWHGIYDAVPGSQFYGDYYDEYPSIVEEIKRTAAANGFDGEYWITEMGWSSYEHCLPNCDPTPGAASSDSQPWPRQATDKIVAKYYARGIVMHLGMDVAAGLGGTRPTAPWSYPAVRYLNTLTAGIVPAGVDVRITGAPGNLRSYGFRMPDGDTLFGLWTDGVAGEGDTGFELDLRFVGLSGRKASVLNVLYGFEQQLITADENGDLMIRDLLVRDYPLLIHISND